MKNKLLRVLISGFWLLMLLSLVFQRGTLVRAEDTTGKLYNPIYILDGQQYLPQTDGKTVVWVHDPLGNHQNQEIYAMNFVSSKPETGQPFVVAASSLKPDNPAVDNGVVVWEQTETCSQCKGHDIYAKNLATGEQFPVSTSTADETQPTLSGNIVVWYSRDENGIYSLEARDLSSMAPPVKLAQLAYPPSVRAVIDGSNKQLAWIERQLSTDSAHWRLLTLTLPVSLTSAKNIPTQLLDEGDTQSSMGPYGLDMQGGIAVYGIYLKSTDGFELRMVNLKTGEHRAIVSNSGSEHYPAMNPTTDGRYVYWENYRNYLYPTDKNLEITGYDTITRSYFTVVNDLVNQYPVVRNGVLIWLHSDNSHSSSQIYYEGVPGTLPASRQPITSSNNDRYFFPETGHTLSFGFKYFWDNSGSLPVLGYPQTEEFNEISPDTGKLYTVQYFERERFEYHPENKGTPYETELGRLGILEAQGRGLLSSTPFKAVASTTEPNCTYFVETGHKMCGAFRTYWLTHGLQFGDQGYSFRESLALFGYSISEEFTEDGLTIQYYERAVFEYHPNNPDEYKVLLKRLGSEVLSQRGWYREPPGAR